MPTTALRPNATVSNNWDIGLPALTAHEALNEVVTQPTAPDTTLGHVSTGVANEVCEVAVADLALGAGESVTETRLWVYLGSGNKRGHRVSLRHSTTVLATADFPTQTGWQLVTSTAALTQAQVNDLRAHLQCYSTAGGGGAGTITAYVAYVDLATVAAVAHLLDATSTGVSTTTASLSVAQPLAGTSAGSSTTTAGLTVTKDLAGSSACTSSTTGAVAVSVALAGTSAGSSTTIGAFAGSAIALGAQSTGTATTSGSVRALRSLGGTSTGTSSTTGDARAILALSGISAGTSTTTASFRAAAAALSGTSTALSTTTGTVHAVRALMGSSAGLSTSTGSLGITIVGVPLVVSATLVVRDTPSATVTSRDHSTTTAA